MYIFGKAFKYQFYPLNDDKFVDIQAITAPDSIYIFSEQPSITEAKAGTGNLQQISTWSDIKDGNGKEIDVAAIEDPDDEAEWQRYDYWIAINTPLESGGDVQTIIRHLPIGRIRAHHKPVTVDNNDLQKIYSTIDTIASDVDQKNAIQLAILEAQKTLQTSGYEWGEIWEPQELNIAISYMAVGSLMREQIREPQDDWFDKAEYYEDKGLGLLKNITLKFTTDTSRKSALQTSGEKVSNQVLTYK
jgi:hypothetical protein